MSIIKETSKGPNGTLTNTIAASGMYSRELGVLEPSAVSFTTFNDGGGLGIGAKDKNGDIVCMLNHEDTLALVAHLVVWYGSERA